MTTTRLSLVAVCQLVFEVVYLVRLVHAYVDHPVHRRHHRRLYREVRRAPD